MNVEAICAGRPVVRFMFVKEFDWINLSWKVIFIGELIKRKFPWNVITMEMFDIFSSIGWKHFLLEAFSEVSIWITFKNKSSTELNLHWSQDRKLKINSLRTQFQIPSASESSLKLFASALKPHKVPRVTFTPQLSTFT